MDKTEPEREAALSRLQNIRDEHRALDRQIGDLAARPYLTADEQMEITNLKKLKLRKKDELLRMAEALGVEP